MKPARPGPRARPWTMPAATRPLPDRGSITPSMAARTAARPGTGGGVDDGSLVTGRPDALHKLGYRFISPSKRRLKDRRTALSPPGRSARPDRLAARGYSY